MTKNKKIHLILFLTITQASFAISNVAVLELLHNESVTDHIRIEESRHLTDELRRQAVTVLPQDAYSVLTRDNIIALLPPDEKEAECLAESCAVEIGRAIGVEYITQGSIGMFANKFTISIELYETMSGKLISSIVFESDNIDGLLNAIRTEAKPLFQSIINSRAAGSEVARKPEASVSSGGGIGTPQWIGIGLAAAGIGVGIYGIVQGSKSDKLYKEYQKIADDSGASAKWKKVKDAEFGRNMGYAIGSALLASGIIVYFAF